MQGRDGRTLDFVAGHNESLRQACCGSPLDCRHLIVSCLSADGSQGSRTEAILSAGQGY